MTRSEEESIAMASHGSITTNFSLHPNIEAKDFAQPNALRAHPDNADIEPGGGDSPRFEYLTFDTTFPAIYLPSSDTDPRLPSPPNLQSYTSPFAWSSTRKNVVVAISCCVTLLAAYSAGSYSIASAPLRAKWDLSNAAFNTGVTTWALGFALSPMVLAPFSELRGRRPVFIGSGLLFVVALIGCAVTDSFAGMLVARFFVGASASTFATMVGGVVSDIYHAEDRNTPMAIYSGSALAGTGLGPMLSGFIVQRVSWRWVFWAQVISASITVAGVFLFFKETRGSVLLSRKAKLLNNYLDQLDKYHQNATEGVNKNKAASPAPAHSIFRYKVAADSTCDSVSRLLYASVTTPFKLLATEPVVFFFSLWAAFAWAVLYMTFDAIPLVFSSLHPTWSIDQVGSVFAAITIGTILAVVLSIYQEKLARRCWSKSIMSSPEGRLYFACLESALLPAGLFWFGWTSTSHIHWIVPVLGLGVAQIGIFSIYLAVFNFLADVYHRFASSALAGQSFCRNLLAAVFPLFTDIMFRQLGVGGAGSLLGGLSALLTIVPWVLVFWGPRIRARSKIASEIMSLDGVSE